MSYLADLIERVEKCTGPDRVIDALVTAIVDDRDAYFEDHPQFGRQLLGRHRKPPHDVNWIDHPANALKPYTASLDVVTEMIDATMPAALWDVNGYGAASLTPHWADGNVSEKYSETSALPCLALLLAFLRAKQKESAE